MKKQILNLGKALKKAEQKNINGGLFGDRCDGYGMYYVDHCSQCVNTILPGAPVSCFRNCCLVAY